MIPIIKPVFGSRELWHAIKPMRNPKKRLEQSIAKIAGCKYGLLFPYGRSALWSILVSQGITSKTIPCTAYTCVVTPHAISSSGNKVAFYDVDDGCNTSAKALEKRKSKAIVYTHLYGEPIEIKRKPGVLQIEDACLAIGAKKGNKTVGSLGDVAFFSFNISKHISALEGGCVTTNNKTIYQALLRHKQEHYQKTDCKQRMKKIMLFARSLVIYNKAVYGLLYKVYIKRHPKALDSWDFKKPSMPKDWKTDMTSFQARIGLAQVTKLQSIIEHKRRTAQIYDQHITHSKVIKPSITKEGIYSHYSIQVPKKKRASFIKRLEANGIKTGVAFDYSCACTPFYQNQHLKQADTIASQVINLPIYYDLKEKDAVNIAVTINKIAKELL